MGKSSIQLTGKIDFMFDEHRLTLVANKILPSIDIEVILSSPDIPDETKKKIKVTIDRVFPSKAFKNLDKLFGAIKPDLNNSPTAVDRSVGYFFFEMIKQNMWLLLGHATENKKQIILITYFPTVSTGSYSFKKETETFKQFNPK